MARSPRVVVSPESCLIDDTWKLVVRDLKPEQEITLACRVHEEGVKLYAHAHYVSDSVGTVDVKRDPACDGSYTGIEPMGLIWSQSQEPGQKPGRRLVKSDVTVPMATHVYVLDGFVDATACLDCISRGRWLAKTCCQRSFMGKGVQRIEVREGRLCGTLFIPAGPGPFPGVVDLFGTVGGTVEHRSALLASRGIASLALQYFTPGRGEGLIADIEYFEQGVDYLLRHPKVLKPFAGIVGVSKGGELALIISSLCHKIKACVSINSVDIFTLVQHSYLGVLYPSCELDMGRNDRHPSGGFMFQNVYKLSLEEREPYQIPVEKADCEFLLIHGKDDRSMPPMGSEHVVRRLRKHNKTNHRLLLYPGAGHLLEPPHSPHFFATYHAMFNNLACWGGYGREHARAQEEAWSEMLHFLKTTLEKHCNSKFTGVKHRL